MLEAIDAIVIPFLEALYERFGYVGVIDRDGHRERRVPLPSELILPFAGWSVSKGLTEPLTSSPWTYWGAVIAGSWEHPWFARQLRDRSIRGRPLVERYGSTC